MKKIILSGIAMAMISCASANAADLPARVYTKAPPMAPLMSWTGCYIGANGGVGWAHQDWYDPQAGRNEGSDTTTGGQVGGQLGCDYQVTPYVVLGVQGSFDWASFDGSHPYTDDPRYTDTTHISSISTLTGRLGYLVQPQTLLYVKGGGAWVRDHFTENCSPAVDFCPADARATRGGWLLGVGAEYMIQPNWSAFLEYNYMDFGRQTSTLTYTDSSTYNYNVRQNVSSFLIGVNYRFGGPVVARY